MSNTEPKWLPTNFTPPLSEDFPSDGPQLVGFVNIAWMTPETDTQNFHLDEWQEWLLNHVLERYPKDHPNPELAGRLRYRQVVISMGRQNGKSVLGAILGLYGLLLHVKGPLVIGIASSREQAEIIYTRTALVVNENPSLKRRFQRTTIHRGMKTADGRGNYEIKPANSASIQGLPLSLGLFDELHLSKSEQWSAMILGTAQRDNGIVVGITTAGDTDSLLLHDLYKIGKNAIDNPE